jgi:CHAT domain-containing protein
MIECDKLMNRQIAPCLSGQSARWPWLTVLIASSFLLHFSSQVHADGLATPSQEASTSAAPGEDNQSRIDQLLEDGNVKSALAASEDFLSKSKKSGDAQRTMQALATMGAVFLAENANDLARRSFEEALQTTEKLKSTVPAVAQSKARILINLAVIDELEGDISSAEKRLSEALAIQEKVLPRDHIDRAATLIGFAKISQMRGQYQTEEKFWRQALAMRQKLYVPRHYNIAVTLEGLAGALEAQGKDSEAEPLLRKALSYRSSSNKPNNPHLASIRQHLAVNLRRQGKLREAESLLLEALKIRGRSDALPGDRARNMVDLALVYISEHRYRDAKARLEAAITIYKSCLTDTHPWLTEAQMHLALVEFQLGDTMKALKLSRQTSSIFASRPPANAMIANLQFQDHILYAWRAYNTAANDRAALLAEAFEIAQRASVTSVAKSATSMAARLSATDTALQAIIRDQQDANRRLGQAEAALVGALSRNANDEEVVQYRGKMESAKAELAKLDEGLHKSFPAFELLVRPAPLSLKIVQSKLAKDEILLFAFVAYSDVYLWAITSDDVRWTRSQLSSDAAEGIVKKLRDGLIFGPADEGANSDTRPLYDLGLSYSLYSGIFGSATRQIRDKRRIYYVPTSFLATLPLSVLIDSRPEVPRPNRSQASAYGKASWIIRNHEICVLPDVATLRSFGLPETDKDQRKSLIGFADPIYNDAQTQPLNVASTERGLPRGARRNQPSVPSSPVSGLEALKMFDRLEGTRDELEAVGAALKADQDDLFLGAAANEENVKLLSEQGRLAEYRVVYFAMHGIVSNASFGNVSVGNPEPSLVMTVPSAASVVDDGLLSTSEIAELRLNADWVVLSACDTAAGESASAEALSGLARAFFYAGARSLIVTQWGASDLDTKAVMSRTFSEIAADPKIRRSEGLRRAMLARIEGATTEDKKWDSYPSYWGPFELVVGAN